MNTDEIKRLANLARLSVPEAELETVGKDVSSILGFVDKIQAVQLDGQTQQSADKTNVFREDVVAPLAANHDLIEAAPLHQDHFVKVPKVIE
ncbi:MAG: aspartyl/glutamyl-tRNA(Asn/Gln) amidotransferase subunit [Candidatus Nomurabacteria bacterium]|nr:aspartyl/glutamyl-tRNA(Asn/Gln) amidotransferase subunit [Candidatus Nomurabacteria bacterium]